MDYKPSPIDLPSGLDDLGVTRCVCNGSQVECYGPGIAFTLLLDRTPCQVSVSAPPSVEWTENLIAERLGFEPRKPEES